MGSPIVDFGAEPPRTTKARAPDEKAEIVRRIETAVAGGEGVWQACRAEGVAAPTYYRWRERLGWASPVRRRSRRKDQPSREALLEAAKTVFFRDGYGASLDAVASAAGVARQTLYNQFGSKARLFREVARSVYERMLEPILSIEEKATLEETLFAYGQRYLAAAFDPEGMQLLRLTVAELRDFPDLGRTMQGIGAARALPVLIDYLASRRPGGDLGADPAVVAEAFLGSLVGHARHRAMMGLADPHEEEHRQALLRHSAALYAGFLQSR